MAAPRRRRGQRPAPLGLPHRRRPGRPAARALHRRADRHGITETHKYREPVGAPPSADYREVAFDASDGVHLSGWYRPTRNGATLLVLHGGGGDRTGAVAHAKLLARHGYGVLLYDARGRGESEGPQNAFGWGWTKDVAGAIAFLKSRPEVDPQRIGGLGLSTGADVLIQAAGQGADLRAVVADGTAAESFEDWRRLQGITAMTPMFAAEFATVRLTSGAKSGPPLRGHDQARHARRCCSSPRAANEEYDFNVNYDRDAGDRPVEHWNLPDGRPHRRDPPRGARVRAPRDGLLRPGPLTPARVGASGRGR